MAQSAPARTKIPTEQRSGINRLGLIFPSPYGKHWRSSNFNRNVLKRAYLEIGWRDADGSGSWTLAQPAPRLCATALFTWKLDVTDVSRMAGHAKPRTTASRRRTTTAPASGPQLLRGLMTDRET